MTSVKQTVCIGW